MIKQKLHLLLIIVFITPQIIFGRSIHRPLDPNLPTITIHDNLEPSFKYTLTDSHIKHFPLFEAYNETYLNNKKLPDKPIVFRHNPKKNIDGKILSKQLEKLIQEILSGKTEFTNFVILKKRDFNFKTKCGLIVLKFKKAPFVAKVFLETPRSLARPYSKGILPMGMFVMGGSNRHLNGFTRIKNMENIQAKINNHPLWSKRLSVPRKWFWTPKNPKWLHINAQNVGHKATESTKIPAIYAVIADEIIILPNQPPSNGSRNLSLCKELNFALDPNANNFVIEKHSLKLVMYDTEHFPTLIGEYFIPIKPAQKYFGWYIHLARKFLKQRIFSLKKAQKKRQDPGSIYPLY